MSIENLTKPNAFNLYAENIVVEDIGVTGTMTCVDLEVTNNANIGNNLNVANTITATGVRVEATGLPGGLNFEGIGTLDWYSTGNDSATLEGTFIASNHPTVNYHLTRIGNICHLTIDSFTVPNADLNASGSVFLTMDNSLYYPNEDKYGTYPLINSDSAVVSDFELSLSGSDMILTFNSTLFNASFTKGANDLDVPTISFTYTIV